MNAAKLKRDGAKKKERNTTQSQLSTPTDLVKKMNRSSDGNRLQSVEDRGSISPNSEDDVYAILVMAFVEFRENDVVGRHWSKIVFERRPAVGRKWLVRFASD